MHARFGLALALASSAMAVPHFHRDFLNQGRDSSTACATGVHIIAARGSTEPPGEGPLQAVSASIEQSVPGSNDIAVVYPATLIGYDSSEADGVTNMKQEIASYVQQCPTGKIVLLGFSQGGQVVSDVLGGGSINNSPPIDHATYAKNIVAAVTFGDPAFVAGQPYDKGTATSSGRFARTNLTALNQWASVYAAFCEDHDFFCDSGDSLSTHTSEVATNGAAGAAFVVNLVNG